MAEIINLRQARKARDRAEAKADAAAARAIHGRSRAEAEAAAGEREALNRTLDGARLETPDPD